MNFWKKCFFRRKSHCNQNFFPGMFLLFSIRIQFQIIITDRGRAGKKGEGEREGESVGGKEEREEGSKLYLLQNSQGPGGKDFHLGYGEKKAFRLLLHLIQSTYLNLHLSYLTWISQPAGFLLWVSLSPSCRSCSALYR